MMDHLEYIRRACFNYTSYVKSAEYSAFMCKFAKRMYGSYGFVIYIERYLLFTRLLFTGL